MTLFACGDVMIGRGVDQILPRPNHPGIQESCVRDAREYVELAELTNGPIPRPVEPAYVWGDALTELERAGPDVRIINLETSVTRHETHWPGKGIHYRVHPDNIGCLTAAQVDVCVLANNHVLDYGYAGLHETLGTLSSAGIKVCGAGRNLEEARGAAIVDLEHDRRVVVFSVGLDTSGIPESWSAGDDVPGVDLLPDLSLETADAVIEDVGRIKRPGDVIVLSIHWGSNWGYDVTASQVRFAHHLLDGPVDLIHGHSSHHPRPIETYRGKLVLYGCGDFIDDYEGISGYEEFRDDLVLMYFPRLDPANGQLLNLSMFPLRICKMRPVRPSVDEVHRMRARLLMMSQDFGSEFDLNPDGSLVLRLRTPIG